MKKMTALNVLFFGLVLMIVILSGCSKESEPGNPLPSGQIPQHPYS